MREERQPASPEVTEVVPGILRMQLPIQLPGLGHVNCYALCDDRGLTVVDPGLPGPKSWSALEQRLASAGFRVADVHTVVVTHSHPDHFGGAGTLRHEAGAEVVSHRSFRSFLDVNVDLRDGLVAEASSDTSDAGTTDGEPEDSRASVPWGDETPWGGAPVGPPRRRRLAYRLMRALRPKYMRAPAPSRRLDDADTVQLGGREWVALHTPGHTVDHLCLFCPDDGTVLSGDHVLPTITPHISGLSTAPGAATERTTRGLPAEGPPSTGPPSNRATTGPPAVQDPLSAFFGSLDRVAALDGVTKVLPAHGHPFTDLAGRAEAIKVHHHSRLEKLREAARETAEASVSELSRQLFSERAWGPMAESETYAHLEHLRRSGEMTARRIGEHLHYRLLEPQA